MSPVARSGCLGLLVLWFVVPFIGVIAIVESRRTACRPADRAVRVDVGRYPKVWRHVRRARAHGAPTYLRKASRGARERERAALRMAGVSGSPSRFFQYPPARMREARSADVMRLPHSERGVRRLVARHVEGTCYGQAFVFTG